MSDGDYLRGWQDCARQVSEEQDDLMERAEQALAREERRRAPSYATYFGRRVPFLPIWLALAPAYFALGLGAGDKLQATLSGGIAMLFAVSALDDLVKRGRRRRAARRAERAA